MPKKRNKHRNVKDENAKKILSLKIVQAVLIRDIFPVFRDYPLLEIVKYIEPYNTGDSIEGNNRETQVKGSKTIKDLVYYLHFPEGSGTERIKVNIEMQGKGTDLGYPIENRELYYWSSLITAQHGTEFQHDEYGKLVPVTCIWIIVAPERKNRGIWKIKEFITLNQNEGNPSVVKQRLNAIWEINLGKREDGIYTENVSERC